MLNEHKGNMKKTWQILNNCINKNKQVSSLPKCFKANNKELSENKDIANGFNNFFANVGPNLAKTIPACEGKSFYDYMSNNVQTSFFMQPTCETEINSIIRMFQNKTSCGHDGISMNIVKNIAQLVSKPFSHICNLSLYNGVFPENMKIAKIVPIFKAGDNQLFTNYRPVSLLPQFSKILEKIFNNRIVSYITKNNILYSGQYGFRSKFSTSLAILDLVEQITSNIDDKKCTIGVFIDLKKAFDTKDHIILLVKL